MSRYPNASALTFVGASDAPATEQRHDDETVAEYSKNERQTVDGRPSP